MLLLGQSESSTCSFHIDSQPTDWRLPPGKPATIKSMFFASWQFPVADNGFRPLGRIMLMAGGHPVEHYPIYHQHSRNVQTEMDGDVLAKPMTPKTGAPPFVNPNMRKNCKQLSTTIHYQVLLPLRALSLSLPSYNCAQSPSISCYYLAHKHDGPSFPLFMAKHRTSVASRNQPLKQLEASAVDELDGAHPGPLSKDTKSSNAVRWQRSEFSMHRLYDALEKSN